MSARNSLPPIPDASEGTEARWQWMLNALFHIHECMEDAKQEIREAKDWQKQVDDAEVKQATQRAERRRWFAWGYWLADVGMKHRIELVAVGALAYGVMK